MYHESLFYAALLSQAVLISLYYPELIANRMKWLLATHPPATHPKLYPNPVEFYEKGYRRFLHLNRLIFAIGLILIVGLTQTQRTGKWDHAFATWYFLLQFVPFALLDRRAIREYRLMRETNSSSRRRAELQPRRLMDFVSPHLLGAALGTYVGFSVFIIYLRRFDFPWFGGYQNIVGVTVLNSLFAGMIAWLLYGRKLNPHQAFEDRRKQIETVTNGLFLTSIAATLFIALSILLSAFEVRQFKPFAQCVYFQLIAVFCLRVYLVKPINFDVYRNDPAAA